MKITRKIAEFLHKKLQNTIKNKPPDFVVGSPETGIYLHRWWLIPRNPFFNIYYHNFQRSDVDLALHDHSYINISFLLDGKYVEHTEKHVMLRNVGDIRIRLPKTLHRIELLNCYLSTKKHHELECWSLFITGPRVREWGFQDGPVVRNWLGFKTKENWLDHTTFLEKYKNRLNYK